MTIELFFDIFEGTAFGIGFYSTLLLLKRGFNYRYFWYSLFSWLFDCLGFIVWTFSDLFLDPNLLKLAFSLILIGELFLLLQSETLSRDAVEPVKIVLYAIMATIFVIETLNQTNTFITSLTDGGQTVYWKPAMGLSFFVPLFFSCVVYFYNLAKMNRHAPKSFKSYSRLYVAGVILAGVASPLMLISSFQLTLPGLEFIVGGIGLILMAYTTFKKPKMIFILPFKALRLTVIETQGGISLFTHKWDDSSLIDNEDLWAGMLQGVNLIFRESLNKGDVQEIKLANAMLLVQHSKQYPVACIVVATKVSKMLRDGLRVFAQKFFESFANKFNELSDVSKFAPASELVAESFPFIPSED